MIVACVGKGVKGYLPFVIIGLGRLRPEGEYGQGGGGVCMG